MSPTSTKPEKELVLMFFDNDGREVCSFIEPFYDNEEGFFHFNTISRFKHDDGGPAGFAWKIRKAT